MQAGYDFYYRLTNALGTCTKVKFVANSNTTSDKVFYTDANEVSSYIVTNGEWFEIHTSADEFLANEDCSYMFHNCQSLTLIDLSSLNTDYVKNMNQMFYDCQALTSLDLSNFNTRFVTNMNKMFYCPALTSLDVSNFNTANVTDMSYMFYECRALTSLDLSNFNTENVTSMYWMFVNCLSLASLDLSSFSFTSSPEVEYMLATGYPNEITVKVTEEGYNYLFDEIYDGYVKFVKPDGTDWE